MSAAQTRPSLANCFYLVITLAVAGLSSSSLYASPPSIVVQPASLTIIENQTATFNVSATGSPAPTYQWYRNGVLISAATLSSYTTPLATLPDSGTTYQVKVSNSHGTVLSQVAVLTVIPDTVGPYPVSTLVICGTDKVVITFNELVDPFTATEPTNYDISDLNSSGVLNINSVVLLPDGRSVCLALAQTITPAGLYVITMFNVEDLAGNVMLPNPAFLTFQCNPTLCATDALVLQVLNLVPASLNSGQGNALTSILNNVCQSLANANVGAACNQLQAFINMVNAHISSNALTSSQGQALINAATAIRAVLGC